MVAAKVLPQRIAKPADLDGRFERKARAVASLNHPHICVLHGIGPVMELSEGETPAVKPAASKEEFQSHELSHNPAAPESVLREFVKKCKWSRGYQIVGTEEARIRPSRLMTGTPK